MIEIHGKALKAPLTMSETLRIVPEFQGKVPELSRTQEEVAVRSWRIRGSSLISRSGSRFAIQNRSECICRILHSVLTRHVPPAFVAIHCTCFNGIPGADFAEQTLRKMGSDNDSTRTRPSNCLLYFILFLQELLFCSKKLFGTSE